jgi:hypothetical protein
VSTQNRALGLFSTTTQTLGTNEVQTLAIGGTPTSGTFILQYGSARSSTITWSSTDATLVANIQTALEAIPGIGSGGVTVTDSTLSSGIGNALIEFTGSLAKKDVSELSVYANNLAGTGPTLAITTTTAGVDATGRSDTAGAVFVETTNARAYLRDAATLPAVTSEISGVRCARVALTGAAIAAGTAAWQNSHAQSILILGHVLDITTASSGASTIDAGLTAVSATTVSDSLLDGVSGASIAVFDSRDPTLDSGANAKAQKLAAGKWITWNDVTGDATGLVGVAYIYYTIV